MKPSLRFEIFKRDSFTCRYCGQTPPSAILEIDHVIPLSAGGDDDPVNLVTSCFLCNRGKSARLLSDVPQERSIAEKAGEIAEQELQIASYNHWRAQQKVREDKELQSLLNLWSRKWGDRYWENSTVRRFLKKLGVVELREILEIVSERTQKREGMGWDRCAWLFLCGICRHNIKDSTGE